MFLDYEEDLARTHGTLPPAKIMPSRPPEGGVSPGPEGGCAMPQVPNQAPALLITGTPDQDANAQSATDGAKWPELQGLGSQVVLTVQDRGNEIRASQVPNRCGGKRTRSGFGEVPIKVTRAKIVREAILISGQSQRSWRGSSGLSLHGIALVRLQRPARDLRVGRTVARCSHCSECRAEAGSGTMERANLAHPLYRRSSLMPLGLRLPPPASKSYQMTMPLALIPSSACPALPPESPSLTTPRCLPELPVELIDKILESLPIRHAIILQRTYAIRRDLRSRDIRPNLQRAFHSLDLPALKYLISHCPNWVRITDGATVQMGQCGARVRLVDHAAEHGRRDVLTFLASLGLDLGFSSLTLERAAGSGSIRTVRFLRKRLHAECVPKDGAMDMAAIAGNVSIVRFLHERCGVPCVASAIIWAAALGRMDVLKYLYPRRTQEVVVGSLTVAARCGRFAAMVYLHDQGTPLTPEVLDEAAGSGHWKSVMYLHEIGAECTAAAMDGAAGSGSLNIVRFLHRDRSEGCTTAAIDNAAGGGHLDIITFLQKTRNEGCTAQALINAARHGHSHVVDHLLATAAATFPPTSIERALHLAATESGCLPIVRTLHALRAPGSLFPILACLQSAEKGFVSVLKFFLEEVPPFLTVATRAVVADTLLRSPRSESFQPEMQAYLQSLAGPGGGGAM
ncbi:hypothetical protein BDK51DRAFT_40868 [Blyttiomyces helicus]|uniref:Uncharacterized protein n=1 Tax=Blyttiomyces helicus TaxID=388810 RepID=A0A4P9WCM2_9FUNG|nr:hypothetical protein BDK51DRAFT_40868 [Blyttiomyces helicus]|eukprot:RKO89405.1 hypothetical protein BDK51DRAFT_40868 [Blyttiomyces helicus]